MGGAGKVMTRPNMAICDTHREELESEGFTVVHDFLRGRELAESIKAISSYFPSHRELLAMPERYSRLARSGNFPFVKDCLNYNAVHPEIIAFSTDFLKCTALRLGQSLLQVK